VSKVDSEKLVTRHVPTTGGVFSANRTCQLNIENTIAAKATEIPPSFMVVSLRLLQFLRMGTLLVRFGRMLTHSQPDEQRFAERGQKPGRYEQQAISLVAG
jgi:hypothetical protein